MQAKYNFGPHEQSVFLLKNYSIQSRNKLIHMGVLRELYINSQNYNPNLSIAVQIS